MTAQSDPPSPERLGRPPRFVVAVLSLVVLAIAGWSAVWYFGTRKADALMTEWLASEAVKGRTYECSRHGIGGYPFRVEVSCKSPVLDIADSAPRIRVEARDFRAVAQVWDISHVIFEIDGPIRLESGDRRNNPEMAVNADWQLLQGSLRAPEGRVARVDLAITGLTVTPDPATLGPAGGAAVSARHVDLHGRNTESRSGVGRDYDVAFGAQDLVVTLDGRAAPEAVDVAFVGQFDSMPYPPPREPEAFLAAWRENGGSVAVERLSAAQGDSEIRASGRVVPDGAGRPEGTVTVSLAGPDINTPGSAGAFGGLAPIIALALRLTGKPDQIDGRTALSGEIEIREGTVYLGAMPITELPRLF
ncbi:DUF2125 domain-containing protein [Microbaculum marinum]|uniref:DUF2125 domain-containing protein n=1 Tax=Microbaculum marinum TaxID=1764581 RepID=A0AAW9RJA1_9HYPH